jgi:hypothetical protein
MNDNHNVDQVDVRYYSPNQITISSARAGTIVFAAVMYPGWICKVDGVPIPLKSYDGLFRSVIVNDGNHIMNELPSSFVIHWMAVSVVTWVLQVLYFYIISRRRKHHVVLGLPNMAVIQRVLAAKYPPFPVVVIQIILFADFNFIWQSHHWGFHHYILCHGCRWRGAVFRMVFSLLESLQWIWCTIVCQLSIGLLYPPN